ncbi:hypothetical protein MRI28_31635 [Nocardiopsis dassonvillei]|uniref:hypothetical protein n=1 Tax=Nocardiopsis dassonvillei TaxID=2014 RepID=UPI00200E27E2|nr:hypothetical protein [Nocardiopsis dassonvillei]MCK9874121.1 hypothetical protein [Nocardiopsis dassonvillei]
MNTPVSPLSALLGSLAWRWHATGHGDRPEVAVSVIASVCLFDASTADLGHTPLTELTHAPPQAFITELWARWNLASVHWPPLHRHWLPFFEWMFPEVRKPGALRAGLVAAAIDTARAALDAGLCAHLARPDTRHGVNVLGRTLDLMRDPSAEPAAPQTPTPALGVPGPGGTVTDAHTGTGTRVLHLAGRLRKAGIDPADITWQLRCEDPLTAATVAASSVLWGTADRTMIAVAAPDDPSWVRRAQADFNDALRRYHY